MRLPPWRHDDMGLHILYLCMAVDEASPALANQVNWIRALAGTDGVDRVTVLTPRAGEADLPANVEVVVSGARRWSSHRVRKARRFYRALRGLDLDTVDLAFIAMGGGPYPALLLPAKLRYGFPVIQWKADPAVTAATRAYVRWCDDLVVTATPGSMPIDDPSVVAIGHGVDTDRFAPPGAPTDAPGPRDLVAVGRIAPVKRIDAAIRAVAAHRDRFGTAPTLDLIGPVDSGNRSHLDALEALIDELGLREAVRVVGTVPYEEMPDRLATYGACIQLGETALDKAILEAMAVGLPIVTSNGRTLEALPPELAARVGVPPDDAAAQADRIHELLTLPAPERQALGADLRDVVVRGHALATLFDRALGAAAHAGLLEDGGGGARDALASLSPRRRSWELFLAGLPLDPDALEVVEPTGPNDVIICGSSRSGTTLLTASLFQPPACVTVMEPWDGMRLPPAELFASLRRELAGGTLRRGRLDVPALEAEHVARWCADGARPVPVASTPETVVAVKWPIWWRWLERLPDTRFLVCLRDPVETIRSYAGTGGRLAEGRDYATAFNASMHRTLDEAARTRPALAPDSLLDEAWLRRIELFDHVHEHLIPHLDRPNVLAVRYEDWFDDPDAVLDRVGTFLGVELGRSPVRITAPDSRAPTSDPLGDAIRARSRTAAALGYA